METQGYEARNSRHKSAIYAKSVVLQLCYMFIRHDSSAFAKTPVLCRCSKAPLPNLTSLSLQSPSNWGIICFEIILMGYTMSLLTHLYPYKKRHRIVGTAVSVRLAKGKSQLQCLELNTLAIS